MTRILRLLTLSLAVSAAVGCGGPDAPAPAVAGGAQGGNATPTTSTVTFAPAPTATSQVCPASPDLCISARNRDGGPPEGGTLELFIGTGLSATTAVTFGGVATPSVSVDPGTGGLLVDTPPHAAGFVDVVMTNPGGQTATSANFHYGPPPVATGFGPTTVKRGDLVTVTGSGFETFYGIQVSVSGTGATLVSRTATELVFTAPTMNPGSYPVVVANFDGQYAVAPGLLVYPGP